MNPPPQKEQNTQEEPHSQERPKKRNWKGIIIGIIGILIGFFAKEIIVPGIQTITNKKAEEFIKSPEDIIIGKQLQLDISGFNTGWRRRDKEVIEAFLKLKTDNPEQYIDIELNPYFFINELLTEDNLPFLRKEKSLLKKEEVCYTLGKDKIKKHYKTAIENLFESTVEHYYKDFANSSGDLKQFLLDVCGKDELDKFSEIH